MYYLLIFGVVKLVGRTSESTGKSEMWGTIPHGLAWMCLAAAVTWFMRGKQLRIGLPRLFVSEWVGLNAFILYLGAVVSLSNESLWWVPLLPALFIASAIEKVSNAGKENYKSRVELPLMPVPS